MRGRAQVVSGLEVDNTQAAVHQRTGVNGAAKVLLLVLATLAALLPFAAEAGASSATKPRLDLVTPFLSPGDHATFAVEARKAGACALRFRGPGGSRSSAYSLRTTQPHIQWQWRVPRAVRTGRWVGSVTCAQTLRGLHASHAVLRQTFHVKAKKRSRRGGRANIVATRSMRVALRGAPPAGRAGPSTSPQGPSPNPGRGAASNPFAYGQCTYYAYERRSDIFWRGINAGVPWGHWDAYQWADNARRGGFAVGSTPQAGALVVFPIGYGGSSVGHVAYVEQVYGDGSYLVSERNWNYNHNVTYRHVYDHAGIQFVYGGAPPSPPQPVTPPFTARIDVNGQTPVPDAGNNVHLTPGSRVLLAFNVRFNQAYDHAHFVLRPNTATSIAKYVYFPDGPEGSRDWPGANSPDGAVGYYRATIGVPQDALPGSAFLQWRVVNTATGQDSGLMPSVNIVIDKPGEQGTYPAPDPNAPAYRASVVSQSFSRVIAPGGSGTVTLKVRNTGKTQWDGNLHLATPDDSPIRFGADGVLPGGRNRVAFQDAEGDGLVAPGEVATFAYKLIAGGQATAFRQRLDFTRDAAGGPRFGDEIGIYIPIVVADAQHFPPEVTAADCTWQYVNQTGTPVGTNGRIVVGGTQSSQFTLTIRNTSDLCPWFASGSSPLRLGTDRPRQRGSGFADLSNGWISVTRVALPHDVAPGETVDIAMGLKAAAGVAPGDYNEYMTLVIEDKFWLADVGTFIPIHRQ